MGMTMETRGSAGAAAAAGMGARPYSTGHKQIFVTVHMPLQQSLFWAQNMSCVLQHCIPPPTALQTSEQQSVFTLHVSPAAPWVPPSPAVRQHVGPVVVALHWPEQHAATV